MLITRSQLLKIIEEEISRELSEASAETWNQEVMRLLKHLDPLYPQIAKQQERVEEIILQAFNEVETNPEISAVLLSKAIKGFSREKANRTLASQLIAGTLKRLSPEAAKMFTDSVDKKKPSPRPVAAPEKSQDDALAARSKEVTQPGYKKSWKKDGHKITYY